MNVNDSPDAVLREANSATIRAWSNFLDLPVTLNVELGRTQISARELLDLEVDSIIQLSRSTGEGIEILAGEQKIACGEIILIENNYGVRISELCGSASG